MEFLEFVPEPNCGRGTLGIIWNCFSTLFLVVWVSCHPETLRSSSTESWLYRRKLVTSAGYLLFPELGALIAIDALFGSIQLRREIRQIPKWDSFSLKQAFLVAGLTGLYQKGNGEKVDPSELGELARSGRLDPNDFPTEHEIEDRSKSSGVLKAISISQTLWFMVNMVWRLRSGHQIAPLEDLTVAHAFCGFIMFVAWFRCPQDVHRPFCVPVQNELSATPESHATRATRSYELSDQTELAMVVVLFGIFTGIHLAAWNYPFPTIPEAWIWRGCSIMVFWLGVLAYNAMMLNDEKRKRTSMDVDYLALATVALYGIVRMTILVVAFMAFRRAPASIYDKPTWSAYWPHLG